MITKKKEMKMNGRKGGWGRKSLMDQGEKEKLKISLRLRTYGTNLTFVDKALSFGEHDRDLPLSIMRRIQTEASQKFNIPTDRSAWRTKSGIKAWFCEYWNDIKEFVFEEVSKIDTNSIKSLNNQSKGLSSSFSCDLNCNQSEYLQHKDDDPIETSIITEPFKEKDKNRPVPQSDFFYYMSIDYLLNNKVVPAPLCMF